MKNRIGWIWAVLCALLAPALFFSFEKTPQILADITGMKISPIYSGGEIAQTIIAPGYKVFVHRPVFDGLFSERKDGFIQLDFEPNGQFPATIEQDFSYTKNGSHGFRLFLDTAKPEVKLTAHDDTVLAASEPTRTRKAIIVRIALKQ